MVSWNLGLCYSGKSGWRARLVRTGGLCPPPSQGRPSLVGPPCLPGGKVWPVKHRPLLHPSCCLHSLASGLFWEPPFFLLLLLLPPAEVSLHTGAEKASNLVSKKLFYCGQKIHETSPILRVSLTMFEENVGKKCWDSKTYIRMTDLDPDGSDVLPDPCKITDPDPGADLQ